MQNTVVAHESAFGKLTIRSTDKDREEADRAPMFRSLESALVFAYTWRARLGVKVGKVGEFTGPDCSALLLSVHEKKTQAQFILDVIESHLTPDQRALLDATYGGERGERAAGIDRLVCQFEHTNRNRALVRMILMREFVYGETYSPSLSRIARECGVNQSTASRTAAQITPEILAMREAAHKRLRPAFMRRGWIEREPLEN